MPLESHRLVSPNCFLKSGAGQTGDLFGMLRLWNSLMSFRAIPLHISANRMVVRFSSFESAIGERLVGRGGIGSGHFTWNYCGRVREVVVQDIELSREWPDAKTWNSLTNHAVIAAVDDLQPSVLAEIVRRIAPQPTQSVAILLVDASNASHWAGVLWLEGQWQSLDEVVVSGPHLLRLVRQPDERPLSDDEDRWTRLAGALGNESLLGRLHQLVVTQFGCGRMGNLMAAQLTTMGVDWMRVSDHDMQQFHNQDAAPLIPDSAVGYRKSAALGRQLHRLRPKVNVAYSTHSILERQGIEFLMHRRPDLCVTCVDDNAARLRAAELCHRELVCCHLDVASHVQRLDDEQTELRADVRLSIPGYSGCVGCLGASDDTAIQQEVLYRLGSPQLEGMLNRGKHQEWTATRSGSLLPLNQTAVGLAGLLIIGLLQGSVSRPVWQRIRWTPESGMIVDGGIVGETDGCAICRR